MNGTELRDVENLLATNCYFVLLYADIAEEIYIHLNFALNTFLIIQLIDEFIHMDNALYNLMLSTNLRNLWCPTSNAYVGFENIQDNCISIVQMVLNASTSYSISPFFL